jgi:hypothetical protein
VPWKGAAREKCIDNLGAILYNISMLIKRKGNRLGSSAMVQINELLKQSGQVKDIDILGCRVRTEEEVEVFKGDVFKLTVIPEHESRVGKFTFTAEARWQKRDSSGTEIGFLITASPQGREFENYVDYLDLKHSSG